ncbi:MAG TPA: alpha/beta hydrolase-fold protein [Luteitalea sp.]|nr:alpha/beta hydrolase-fold protein [Luteitalea sp.]
MTRSARRRSACRLAATALAVVALVGVSSPGRAQTPATPPAAPATPPTTPAGPPRPPQYSSPEVGADGRVTFRVHAPNAQAVRLSAGDIVGLTPAAAQMTKGADGIWAVTVPVPEPGAYRYNFNIDGVATIDLRNPSTSESFQNTWSVAYVPGTQPWDTTDVPHGALGRVTYKSASLGQFRRMHVYTPPGYETGTAAYPVFYLLHGAGDSDDAWTSVGRANFILDSLIAAGKAVPMIVVMPAGHIRGGAPGMQGTEDVVKDVMQDIKPYIESHYRVKKGRADTAMAGLSMGGHQTLNAAFPHLEQFAYIGVYSSGLIGAFPDLMPRPQGGAAPPQRMGPTAAEWSATHKAKLSDPELKKGLQLLWFATGKDDFLLGTTKATVAMFEQLGFAPVYRETDGGHTWVKWRHYLTEFAPMLFKPGAPATSSASR